MSVAEVFYEEGGEIACGSGSELAEGLRDLVPLDDGLTDDDAAEV